VYGAQLSPAGGHFDEHIKQTYGRHLHYCPAEVRLPIAGVLVIGNWYLMPANMHIISYHG
jgi:hypothetical protein